MSTPTSDGATWRKSSFSENSNSDGCVEVAFLPGGSVALRDTKDRGLAAQRYSAGQWAAFVAGVRAGEFART